MNSSVVHEIVGQQKAINQQIAEIRLEQRKVLELLEKSVAEEHGEINRTLPLKHS